MDALEISIQFKQSLNKAQQINILAELTDSDTDTIIECLRDHGEYVKDARCRRCGGWYHQYLSPYCPDCEDIRAAERESIMFMIKVNSLKIKGLMSEINSLKKSNNMLRSTL